jgi:hypothetical protein
MGAAGHRCTSVVSADGNKMTATHERSDDGVNWKPWMEVVLTRNTEGHEKTKAARNHEI